MSWLPSSDQRNQAWQQTYPCSRACPLSGICRHDRLGFRSQRNLYSHGASHDARREDSSRDTSLGQFTQSGPSRLLASDDCVSRLGRHVQPLTIVYLDRAFRSTHHQLPRPDTAMMSPTLTTALRTTSMIRPSRRMRSTKSRSIRFLQGLDLAWPSHNFPDKLRALFDLISPHLDPTPRRLRHFAAWTAPSSRS